MPRVLLAILLSGALLGAEPASAIERGFLDVPASRICLDTDGDGVCEGAWFPAPVKPPDTSNWQRRVIDCGSDGECSSSEINAALGAASGRGDVFVIPAVGDKIHRLSSMISVATDNTLLRCEDGVTLDITGGAELCGGSAGFMCFGHLSRGPSTSWTAGFDRATTTVTVQDASSFAVGDYVSLQARDDNCDELWDSPVGGDAGAIGRQTQHLARITAISGPRVSLDSPLRFDYRQCKDSSFEMLHVSMSENTGLENCTVDGPDSEMIASYTAMLVGSGHGFWLRDNTFLSIYNCGPSVKDAKDALIQSNTFDVIQQINDSCSAVYISQSSDVVVENNVFTRSNQMLQLIAGLDGASLGYNYFRKLDEVANRGIYFHGGYPRAILSEGNDLDVNYDMDNLWGKSGAAVLYRHRARDPGEGDVGHVGLKHTSLTDGTTVTRHTIIGSIFPWMTGRGAQCIDRPYTKCRDWHYDTNEEDLWIEKNVCFGEADGSTTRDCVILAPRDSTHCGGDGSCTYDAKAQTFGDNQMSARSAPAAWARDPRGYPSHSLYRESTTPPDWWCKEACSWSDVTRGIGAFGDDFSKPLCKLPAQIRAEGGTCTPF